MMSRRCSKVFFFLFFLFCSKIWSIRFVSIRDFEGKESCYQWNSFDSFDVRWMEEVCFRLWLLLRQSEICIFAVQADIYIYYNFGYIVKFHLVGFCRKRFVVESFDRSRVRVWMQSWKFFVTGRIDVVGVFFLPPEMQEQPGVPVFRQARENFTSNSKQRGQYLLCSK